MNNSLFHWGIPGMKWGVRRRRPNETITGRQQSQDYITTKSLRRKHISEMSNDELKKLTTRLQLEKQLKDLSASDIGPGKKFVTELLSNVGKQLASKYIASAVEKGLPELLKLIQNANK